MVTTRTWKPNVCGLALELTRCLLAWHSGQSLRAVHCQFSTLVPKWEVRRFETCYESFGISSVPPIDVVSGWDCLSLPSRFTTLSALFRVKATLHNPAAKPASLPFYTSSIEFYEAFRKTFFALAALMDYVWVKLDLRHTACQGVGAASPLGTEALFGCSIHRSTGDVVLTERMYAYTAP